LAHHSITAAALAAILHRADAPRILDLREAEDAAADPRRLPGAGATTLATLEEGRAGEGPVVFTCQRGGKLSQIAAGLERARGTTARYLLGGHLAWVEEGLPLVGPRPVADRWVMPTDPGWNGLAALWVLRRLVDRHARVVPVERAWIAAALQVWPAEALPASPGALARLAELAHPFVAKLAGGPDRLVAGRLTRIPDPIDALDLVDDWLAGAEAAA
jgi:rhodanese-related sulfurtransferase